MDGTGTTICHSQTGIAMATPNQMERVLRYLYPHHPAGSTESTIYLFYFLSMNIFLRRLFLFITLLIIATAILLGVLFHQVNKKECFVLKPGPVETVFF